MARVFHTNKNIWEITFFYLLEMTFEILARPVNFSRKTYQKCKLNKSNSVDILPNQISYFCFVVEYFRIFLIRTREFKEFWTYRILPLLGQSTWKQQNTGSSGCTPPPDSYYALLLTKKAWTVYNLLFLSKMNVIEKSELTSVLLSSIFFSVQNVTK